MKLGILTFHRSINYGAFMQCYALSHRLQKDFPNLQVEVIDYTSPKALAAEENKSKNAADPGKKAAYENRRALFAECCEHLQLSKKRIESENLEELWAFLNEEYDIVVVGSDAVFNWAVRGFPNAYFLKGYHGIKLSYAASVHGLDFRKMTEEQKTYLAAAFSEFMYLGVRDVATEELLHWVDPELKAHHTCDPTLLLDISTLPCDREKLVQKLKKKGIRMDMPLVAIMGGEYTIGRELQRLLKGRAQTIALYEPNSYADAYMDNLDPFEWATVFSMCRGTVTHFFHGTLLSLTNGIPPMPTEPAQGFAASYTSKIRDVLTRLELLRYYHSVPMGRRSKLLRKLGLPTDRKMWKGIAADLQDVFGRREAVYEDIRSRVEKEAESYLDFKAALADCIKQLETKEKHNG